MGFYFMKFTKQQMKFFEKAAEIASYSDFTKQHLGCVAVIKNKIVAAAHNKLKTHPIQKRYDEFRKFNCVSDTQNMHSLHAEIACINSLKDVNINYKDLELYIVRLRKDRDYGLARPCAACMKFIQSKGIRRIFYSTNTGFAFEELSKA